MSHQQTQQPETQGAGSLEHAPQVAVRDGDQLLCPCCGAVLMYLSEDEPSEEPSQPPPPTYPKLPGMGPSPWDILGRRQDAEKEAAWQAYQQAEQAKQDERYAQYLASDDPQLCADYLTVPIDPDVAAYEFPDHAPPALPAPKRVRSQRKSDSPRQRQPKQTWQDVRLDPPYTYQQQRYMAWTFYHLKIQDLELQDKIRLKQAKIERQRNQLGGTQPIPSYQQYLPDETAPKVHPPVQVVEFDLHYWIEKVRQEANALHGDMSTTSDIRETQRKVLTYERGPP